MIWSGAGSGRLEQFQVRIKELLGGKQKEE